MYEQNENQVTKYAEDLFTIKYTVVIPDIGEMWPITQNTATINTTPAQNLSINDCDIF